MVLSAAAGSVRLATIVLRFTLVLLPRLLTAAEVFCLVPEAVRVEVPVRTGCALVLLLACGATAALLRSLPPWLPYVLV